MKDRATLWQNHDFSRLFAAQTISLLGSGATTIGLALFARDLAGGASATAIVGNALTLRIVAFLIFSQPAGVLADRVDRKTVLVASDVVRAGLLLLLPLACTVWHVYALIFAINAVTAFFSPTYEASVPAVVGSEHVVRALSLSRVAIDIENVAAPRGRCTNRRSRGAALGLPFRLDHVRALRRARAPFERAIGNRTEATAIGGCILH